VAFHPTDPDRLLVVERGGTVSIWQLAGPQAPYKAWEVNTPATDAQFLPGGTAIASAGTDGIVRVWDGAGRERWHAAEPHAGAIRAVAVAADRVASAGQDGDLRLWTLDGAPAGMLNSGAGMLLSVAFSPRGDWLAAEGSDTVVHLWRRDSGGHYVSAGTLREPNPKLKAMLPSLVKLDVQWGWDRSLAFAPTGGVLAATGFDGTARLWSLDGTAKSPPLRGPARHHVRSVAFAPDGGMLAVGSLDGTILLWNADGTARGAPVAAHRNAVSSIAFNRTGSRMASASVDGSVRLWNPSDATPAGLLPRAQ
jgi:WD40 repeat protein